VPARDELLEEKGKLYKYTTTKDDRSRYISNRVGDVVSGSRHALYTRDLQVLIPRAEVEPGLTRIARLAARQYMCAL
jgi:hypothetical protein